MKTAFCELWGVLFLLIASVIQAGGTGVGVPQQPALKLKTGVTSSVVSARWAGGWVLVPVQINGVDAGWFKVGTGWKSSAIDFNTATKLGLRRVNKFGVLQEALRPDKKDADWFRVDRLQCGEVNADDLWLTAMDMRGMSKDVIEMTGEGLSGVIGWDLLRSMPFVVDYGSLKIVWGPRVEVASGMTRMALLEGKDVPMVEVSLGEKQRAAACINTANYSGASVLKTFARKNAGELWSGRHAAVKITRFQNDADDDNLVEWHPSLSGVNDARWMSVNGFGDVVDVLASLSASNDQDYGDVQLGYSFLRQFKLTFNGPSRELWVEKAAEAPEIVAFSQVKKGEASAELQYRLLLTSCEANDAATVLGLVKKGLATDWPEMSGDSPLSRACIFSARSTVDALLASGAKINPSPSYRGIPPLVCAATAGDAQLVARLLAGGADEGQKSPNGSSAWLAALQSGSAETAALLESNAAVSADENVIGNAAMSALIQGNLKVAQRLWPLLSESTQDTVATQSVSMASLAGSTVAVEWLVTKARASADNAGGPLPPLMAAILSGRLEKTDAVREALVAFLITHGANVNATRNGVSPLLLAARHGNARIIKLLLEAGAKPERTDFKGRTTILRAAAANQPAAVLKLLLVSSVDVNRIDSTTDRTALGTYAALGNLAACQCLLDAGADPNLSSFTSPALLLATNGEESTDRDALSVVRLLLEREAKTVTSIGNRAGSPLVGAIVLNRSSLLEPLVRAGFDVNEKLFNRVTPLLFASAVADPATVERIIDLGGDLHQVDSNRFSAMAHAAAAGRVQNLMLLIKKGASPDQETADAMPPICAAATAGQLASVKALLAAKADPNAKDAATGGTAMKIAEGKADAAMLEVLRAGGARN